jgi:hypothetical protein
MIKIFKAEFFTKSMLLTSVVITATFLATGLQAQDKGNTLKKSNNEPKVTIKVDKKRDANGNITQYDSTYISSWSSNNSMVPANVDSLMKAMRHRFFNDSQFGNIDSLAMPYGFNFQMNDSLNAFNDSTFFNHNFNNMFGDNFGDFDKILREHQKMMQQFFRLHQMLKAPDDMTPPPAPSKPETPKKRDNSFKKERTGYQVNT